MTTEATFTSAAEKRGQIPLSCNQELLCLFDRGDAEGPFGPRYNIVSGWRLEGEVDPAALQAALDDLVVRHEALRTAIIREATRHQMVLSATSPDLAVIDIPGVDAASRDKRIEQLLIEYETREFSAQDYPLIRAVLARFDAHDSVLVIIAHHSAVDEWSMKLVIGDLAVLYAQRKGVQVAALPDVLQYRDYAVWDRARSGSPAIRTSRDYWADRLLGARIIPMVTDIARSDNLPKNTAAYRFLISAEITSAALELARSTRSTPFMVLLAAYKVFLARRTGETDISVTTFTAGRDQARFQNTVGSFFNLLPLRTDLQGCVTFRDVVARTRAGCIEAYTYDIPFSKILEAAPGIVSSFQADNLTVFSFEVFKFQFPFMLNRELIGDIRYSDIRRRLLSQEVTTDIPDGGLWTLDIDPAGDIVGSLWFNTNLFYGSTIKALVEEFRGVLNDTLLSPDAVWQV